MAPEPIRKSHFGVTLSVAIASQSGLGYLDTLLDEAVGMLGAEVLALLRSTPLPVR